MENNELYERLNNKVSHLYQIFDKCDNKEKINLLIHDEINNMLLTMSLYETIHILERIDSIFHVNLNSNQLQKIQLLIQNEILTIDKTYESDHTCLFISCRMQNYEIVKLLVINGANVNVESGMSCLHCACIRGNYEICKILIEYGANVNSTDTFGHTCMSDIRNTSGNAKKIVQLLLDNHVTITKHILMTFKQDIEIYKMISDYCVANEIMFEMDPLEKYFNTFNKFYN